MSAFLGPIHFWLYNKIQFQENLIDELVAYVTAKGWSDKADQYVSTDRRKLDEVIDEANIHGWLQSRIHDAEGRYAALVLDAAGDDAEKIRCFETGCSRLWRQTGPSGRNGTGSLPPPR